MDPVLTAARGWHRPLVAAVAACLIAVGCAAPSPSRPGASDSRPTVAVFAAASLGRMVGALDRAYGQGAGVAIESSTASSTALRVRIEHGASADLFLSADTKNPDALRAEGLADGEVTAFARNGLTIIVPAGNPAAIATIADLGRPGVKVIAAGDAVPISGYAALAVDRWAATAGADPSFAAAYARNVVSREDNVAAVVTKIELGEGDAAIVYATDVAGATAVEAIALPPAIDVVATYAGVVPSTARDGPAGHALLSWLTSSDGQAFLAGFGFRGIR